MSYDNNPFLPVARLLLSAPPEESIKAMAEILAHLVSRAPIEQIPGMAEIATRHMTETIQNIMRERMRAGATLSDNLH